MKNLSKTLVISFTALAASLLSTGCLYEVRKTGKGDAELLLDREPPAASHALVRLREQPVFPVDEGKKPFAMIGDRDERAPASAKPKSLDEPRLRH